jgi:hypothetical protein
MYYFLAAQALFLYIPVYNYSIQVQTDGVKKSMYCAAEIVLPQYLLTVKII